MINVFQLNSFGLARTQNGTDWFSDNYVMGAFGYLAPEYAEGQKASTKTDVYAFGMVLLELITSRSTTDKRLEEKSLLGWVTTKTLYFPFRIIISVPNLKIVNKLYPYHLIKLKLVFFLKKYKSRSFGLLI